MNTLKFGNGEWYGKKDTILAYNDENSNFKPLPFNFDRASSATRVNKDGLIETVGSGEPRIDYKDDSKGALLLEPSRSNLILNSQKISLSPIKNGTFTDDFAISPDGTQNATKFTAPSIDPYFYQSVSFSAGSYTASIYVKGIGNSIGKDFRIVLGSTSSNPKLEIPSEWTRFEYTATMTSGSATAGLEIPDPAVVGDDVLVWGFQVEQGSYATSYIPTQGGVVTRNSESCSQTVPSGIIGQTEGTLYAELGNIPTNAIDDVFIELSDGTSNNRILFYNDSDGHIRNQIKANGSISSLINTNIDASSNMKIAITYKSNEAKVFINGVQYGGTDTSVVVPSVSKINLENFTGTRSQSSSLKDVKLYNTALTDQEIINLTTI